MRVSTCAPALPRWRWCYGAKRKFSRINMSEVTVNMIRGRSEDPVTEDGSPLAARASAPHAENHLPRV